MWKTRAFALSALMLISTVVSSHSFAADEEQLIRSIERSQEEAARAALTTDSPMLATAAFGAFLRNTRNPEEESALRVIRAFSEKSGMYHKAALLTSMHSRSSQAVEALIKEGDHRLAAAIALAGAEARYRALNAVRTLRMAEDDDIDDERRTRLVTQAERRHQLADLPESFFDEDRDAVTVQLAILAAAYGDVSDLQDTIKGVDRDTPSVNAAKLLYLALVGAEPDEEWLEEVLRSNATVRDRVTQPEPSLSRYRLTPPGMVVCAEALGHLSEDVALPHLHKALSHPDLRVRVEAARSIRRIGSRESARHLAAQVRDCEWPVLVEVCAGLAAIPDHRAIPALIRRLDDETGRFRLDLIYALSAIAGAQRGRSAEEWTAWWRRVSDTFAVDPGKSEVFRKNFRVQDMAPEELGRFYGLPIYSDRVVFVVDTSTSMRGRRFNSLKSNLKETLEELKPDVYFNIVDFGAVITAMHPRGLFRDRRKAIEYVYEMPLTRATRTLCAIERGAWLQEADTLIFLSDGAPTFGQTREWGHILSTIRLFQRFRPMAIYTVDFDPTANNRWHTDWLAAENAGLGDVVIIDN